MTSKLDYLAKYTGGKSVTTGTTEPKKKKKKVPKSGGIKIVDDTISAQPKFKQDDEDSEGTIFIFSWISLNRGSTCCRWRSAGKTRKSIFIGT